MSTVSGQFVNRKPQVNGQSAVELPSVEYGLIRAHIFASLVTLMLASIRNYGWRRSLISLNSSAATPGLRGEGCATTIHRAYFLDGWATHFWRSFITRCHAPGKPARFQPKLGWILFAVWNFAVVLPGWVLVLAGFSQPLEWAEFPIVVDVFVVLAFILMTFGLSYLSSG